jgi:hypothetical protein
MHYLHTYLPHFNGQHGHTQFGLQTIWSHCTSLPGLKRAVCCKVQEQLCVTLTESVEHKHNQSRQMLWLTMGVQRCRCTPDQLTHYQVLGATKFRNTACKW